MPANTSSHFVHIVVAVPHLWAFPVCVRSLELNLKTDLQPEWRTLNLISLHFVAMCYSNQTLLASQSDRSGFCYR